MGTTGLGYLDTDPSKTYGQLTPDPTGSTLTPINPNLPVSASTSFGGGSGTPPAPTYGSIGEAIQAWQAASLHGSPLPLSYYLGQVNPAKAGQGAAGQQLPYPTTTVSSGNVSGTSTNTGSTSAAGSTTLPSDVRQRYLDYLDSIGQGANPGQATADRALSPLIDSPGYTSAEQAKMYISPQEAENIVALSGQPVAGAANAAREKLGMENAARGGNTAGYNATLERVAQQQGRDASNAALQAKLGVEAGNREAATLVGQGRIGQQNVGAQLAGNQALGLTGLEGSGLGNFGERNTAATGTSSGTTNSSQTNTGTSTTGASTPGGTILPGGTGLASGQSGVGVGPGGPPRAELGSPATTTPGLGGTAPQQPPKKNPWAGLLGVPTANQYLGA